MMKPPKGRKQTYAMPPLLLYPQHSSFQFIAQLENDFTMYRQEAIMR